MRVPGRRKTTRPLRAPQSRQAGSHEQFVHELRKTASHHVSVACYWRIRSDGILAGFQGANAKRLWMHEGQDHAAQGKRRPVWAGVGGAVYQALDTRGSDGFEGGRKEA